MCVCVFCARVGFGWDGATASSMHACACVFLCCLTVFAGVFARRETADSIQWRGYGTFSTLNSELAVSGLCVCLVFKLTLGINVKCAWNNVRYSRPTITPCFVNLKLTIEMST